MTPIRTDDKIDGRNGESDQNLYSKRHQATATVVQIPCHYPASVLPLQEEFVQSFLSHSLVR